MNVEFKFECMVLMEVKMLVQSCRTVSWKSPSCCWNMYSSL